MNILLICKPGVLMETDKVNTTNSPQSLTGSMKKRRRSVAGLAKVSVFTSFPFIPSRFTIKHDRVIMKLIYVLQLLDNMVMLI